MIIDIIAVLILVVLVVPPLVELANTCETDTMYEIIATKASFAVFGIAPISVGWFVTKSFTTSLMSISMTANTHNSQLWVLILAR
jgi:hypothetical protein